MVRLGLAQAIAPAIRRNQQFHLRKDRLHKGVRWRATDDQASSKLAASRCAGEFGQPYMAELKRFLAAEKEAGKRIFPNGSQLVPGARPDAARRGPRRDPRPGPLPRRPARRTACASRCPDGVRPPPSLVNIYKELESDLGIAPAAPRLPRTLGEAGRAAAEQRADGRDGPRRLAPRPRLGAVHRRRSSAEVNAQRPPVVFMLWGSYAQKKAAFVDTSRHLVLKAPHPSPLSAHSGFFGCRHFSKANAFLESKGLAADRLGVAGMRAERRSARHGHAASRQAQQPCPLLPKRRRSTMCRTRGPARSTWCASPRPSSPRCARSPASPISRIS